MSVELDCRLLPHVVFDGSRQMALDHALLQSVDENPKSAILRTYGWSQPTLSLGYFQSLEDVESDPRWQGLAIVRRMSGGGALFHHHEVTYSLVLPRSHPLAVRPSSLYRAVHSAILSRMKTRGLEATRRGEDRSPSFERPFLCFLDRDPEDLLISGRKVVGSAQRRKTFAVMQHGSVLLEQSPWTPELPGIKELGGTDFDVQSWVREIHLALESSLGLKFNPGTFSDRELSHANQLERENYTNRVWTARR